MMNMDIGWRDARHRQFSHLFTPTYASWDTQDILQSTASKYYIMS